MFQIPEVVAFLRQFGISPEELGTHSFRKGSSTYCSGGSTACPSMVSLQLRAGWAMAGVTGTYLRYEGAGDQHVGRTVSGLPLDHPDFTVLPPHFPIGNSVVFTAIQILFPGIPSTLTRVAELGLASVVYQWPTLNTLLHPTHLI